MFLLVCCGWFILAVQLTDQSQLSHQSICIIRMSEQLICTTINWTHCLMCQNVQKGIFFFIIFFFGGLLLGIFICIVFGRKVEQNCWGGCFLLAFWEAVESKFSNLGQDSEVKSLVERVG